MESNKIIAEFMGAKIDENYKQYPYTWEDDYPNPRTKTLVTLSSDTLPQLQKFRKGTEYGIYVESLQYHTSWDWLMPVVDEIEMRCQGVPQELLHLSLFSTRQEVYQAVVEFIKHINK